MHQQLAPPAEQDPQSNDRPIEGILDERSLREFLDLIGHKTPRQRGEQIPAPQTPRNADQDGYWLG
jgi:hypothetical protein